MLRFGHIIELSARSTAMSGCAAALMFAACSAPPAQVGPPVSSAATSVVTSGGHPRSWMARGATSGDLLYVSDDSTPNISVFSYPSLSLVGTLTGFYSPYGECVDAAGNIWISNSSPPEFLEYAHGGTSPIAVVDNSRRAFACSVNPKTGDLATTDAYNHLRIYPHAQGPPITYSDPKAPFLYYCAYDDRGNLFVSGWDYNQNVYLDELASGSSTLKTITLNETIQFFSIQWDGSTLELSSPRGAPWNGPIAIYRVRVHGTKGSVVAKLLLGRAFKGGDGTQRWIQGGTIIGVDGFQRIAMWKYPQGGKPTKVVKIVGSRVPWGVAVSPGQHR
jgi:hypothetical protein